MTIFRSSKFRKSKRTFIMGLSAA